MGKLVTAGVLMAFALGGQRGPVGGNGLQALVEAERQFARAAIAKGVRDAFLEFFAPDAIALTPQPQSAVERLRGRPSQPFSEAELTWQPRAGDIAASGELGWLTGPSTFIDRKGGAAPRYGTYLSVWRRQPNGAWRVYLDIGTTTPESVPFPEGFVPVRVAKPYVGGIERPALASLVEADQSLNALAGSDGLANAYGAVAAPSGSRLHRPNTMPAIGRAAIVTRFLGNAERWSFQTTTAEPSKSGDLGYSYGTYTTASGRGAYARIWARDAGGRWWLMADVATAA